MKQEDVRVFSKVSTWLCFTVRRNIMFKICMFPHGKPVFVLRWTAVCDKWTRSVMVMDAAESVKEFRCHHYLCWPACLSQSTSWNFWSKQLSEELNCLLWWEKSIERSLCPSSRDRYRQAGEKTSYAQVKDIHSAFILDFSNTLNLKAFSWAQRGWVWGSHWTPFNIQLMFT